MSDFTKDEQFLAIKDELWNVFTYYALKGNPLYPDLLESGQFLKIGKCCFENRGFSTKPTKGKKGKRVHVTSADLQVIYMQVVKRPEEKRFKGKKIQKKGRNQKSAFNLMGFLDFCDSLVYLAELLHPLNKKKGYVIVLKDILINASRRPLPLLQAVEAKHNLSELLVTEEFKNLWRGRPKKHSDGSMVIDSEGEIVYLPGFATALEALFTFYSSEGDMHRRLDIGGKRKVLTNTMMHAVSYADFTKFCLDFHLCTEETLHHKDVGDVFLASVDHNDESSEKKKKTKVKNTVDTYTIGKLTMDYEEKTDIDGKKIRKATGGSWWRALVRLALVSYHNINPDPSPINKVKAMLLHMWRSINDAGPKLANNILNTNKTHSAALIHCLKEFNKVFYRMWSMEDEFSDYITPKEEERQYGHIALEEAVRGETISLEEIISARAKKKEEKRTNMKARKLAKLEKVFPPINFPK